MSFGNHTPESLLPRSDSKNPATTCKGLTLSGRPCRRALAASVTNSPTHDHDGVVAILDEGAAAAFFCWQHKDQADALAANIQGRSKVVPLKQKSSIDTLIARVGVLDLDDELQESPSVNHQERSGQRKRPRQDLRKRDVMPREWRKIRSPLMTLPEGVDEAEVPARRSKADAYSRPPQGIRQYDRVGRSNVKASWSCCIRNADEEYSPPPRRRQQFEQPKPKSPRSTRVSSTNNEGDISHRPVTVSTPVRRKPVNTPEMQQRPLTTSQTYTTPTRPAMRPIVSNLSPPNPETANFLSFIPPHLSPVTTSALLSELSKPISDADEAGYIYIFWLTPETDVAKPDDDIASSLLDPDEYSPRPSPKNDARYLKHDSSRLTINRLTAQALHRFASVSHGSTQSKKILLKIGRAANIHRRLSQWTKQCGQNITLIRYYPYQQRQSGPDSGSGEPESKRMVPHVHRVERLIHLELADKRVTDKGNCEACGKLHKEWFEIDATRKGVREVDEVVRRWVGWAEQSHETIIKV